MSRRSSYPYAGWHGPRYSNREHYFMFGKSICGKYKYNKPEEIHFSEIYPSSRSICKKCMAKLQAMEE